VLRGAESVGTPENDEKNSITTAGASHEIRTGYLVYKSQ
jgi:hypothetical protein